MSLGQGRRQSVIRNPPLRQEETRLRGHWLFFARVGWMTLVAVSLGLFFASLPTYLTHLQRVCLDNACTYLQLTLHNAHALQALGISVGGYAALVSTLRFR